MTSRLPKRIPLTAAAAFFAVSALVFLLVFGNGRVDLSLASLFYSPEAGGFPLRHHWFVEGFLYKGSKAFMTFIALLLIVLAGRLARRRTPGFTWLHFVAGVLGTLLLIVGVDAVKHLTGIQCPWSLTFYGGDSPYHDLIEELPACFKNAACHGRCFPAGHAMGGFYLFVWAAVFWRVRHRLALACLWGGLAAGFLLGLIRMIQGAHFLSHIVASCWCAALVAYLIGLMLRTVEKRRPKSV